MKLLSSALTLFLFASCAAGQKASAQDVTVLQSKWRTDVYNPALDKDPLSASKARQDEERKQQDVARQNENRARQGEPALPPVVRQSASDDGKTRLIVMYVYEIKIKNTGRKEIRNFTWEYVFSEPGTTQGVGPATVRKQGKPEARHLETVRGALERVAHGHR